MTTATTDLHALEAHSAHNYHPLPVVVAEADGAWVTDVDGRRYLDALAGYSALNFGHRHPALIAAAEEQLRRVTLTSRAFHHDQFAPFTADLARLTGMDAVLPMNTGAEAVETAIKLARRWGYRVKGVPRDQATIVVAEDNFHGRTTTVVGFSTDPDAREDFGPFPAGFRTVPFGDAAALEAAIDDTTVAVLLEPIQGEAGIRIPPSGYLREVRRLTAEHDVLLLADEIQSGLGRTGTTFACELEDVRPDVYLLGKALGGGVVPVSAIAARRELMDVFTPGSHGSTFGGNPLACAVARAVIALLETGEFQARGRELGARLDAGLRSLPGDRIAEVRTIGLWAGIELVPGLPARTVCERMLAAGVLAKDTHETTVRLAPPLVVTEAEVDRLVEVLGDAIR
ncbi:ornithine--oxo-acid transaminase [Egicoccus halophilus]|uniref:ornithine aminotransferase n=1 Tax=Egicoccus halophilus TaxID=1670830 RepID=A0A8J3ET62_9ACTN|nr:ornithine--oxo-acid transaminase [Egicoccus halophilus]GGI03285.1 ornithine--oxo-acid transaminase [Egicoccus halophilus]